MAEIVLVPLALHGGVMVFYHNGQTGPNEPTFGDGLPVRPPLGYRKLAVQRARAVGITGSCPPTVVCGEAAAPTWEDRSTL